MSTRTRPNPGPGTALVTGPTAGIGAAFAEQLAARGHDLVLVARDRARLDVLAQRLSTEYGVAAEVLVADLSDRSQLAAVESRLDDRDRPVHLLVNNAGFGHKRPFLDNTVEQAQEMLDVLVTAVLRLSHAALGAMVVRGGGAIINVSSVSAFLPRGTYSAAKAYVTSMSQWADLAYRDQGVRVMALCPGFTRTEFHARMDVSRESAPGWMWLDADRLVMEALSDLDRGRRVSVPSRRYKLLMAAVKVTPMSVLGRLQGLGR
ncbi:MAG: SDR family NAD(P)-dependent oxidoreductase [Nocardioides sp.]